MGILEHLPIAVADVADVLDVAPQGVVEITPASRQVVHEYDDGSRSATGPDLPEVRVILQWEVLTEAEADAILDLYGDPAKACGFKRSFQWLHPWNGRTYAAWFDGDPGQTLRAGRIAGVSSVTLRLRGVIDA